MTHVLEEASGTNPRVNRRRRRGGRGGGGGGGGKTDWYTYFHIATLNKLPPHDVPFKILKCFRKKALKVVIESRENSRYLCTRFVPHAYNARTMGIPWLPVLSNAIFCRNWLAATV